MLIALGVSGGIAAYKSCEVVRGLDQGGAAVQVLLRQELREAADTLLDMLDDASPQQRASALWVVERLQLQSVIDRVSQISENDPVTRVRHRARRLLRQWGTSPASSGANDVEAEGTTR